MKKLLLALIVFMAPVASAYAQVPVAIARTACGSQSFTNGRYFPLSQDLTGNLCTSGSGGGGGGAVTIADGADVAEGSRADAAWTGSGNATTIGALKGIYNSVNSAVPAGTNVIGGVTIADGSAVTIGSEADAAYAGSGSTTVIGALKGIYTAATSPLAAGTALIGKVGIDQTTPGTTNAVQAIPGSTGGLTAIGVTPTASDNHTNIKNGAGTLYHVAVTNNSATINYLRFYNAATGFNGCNSATNWVYTLAIPASTSAAGFVQDIAMGVNFSTGISICVTSGFGNTDTTNATATAINLVIGYK